MMAGNDSAKDNEPQTNAQTRVLIGAATGAGMAFLGASVINVALPTFQSELNADATDLQWIVSGYNLAIAALLLSAGAFSDHWGHARVFRIGLLLVAIASVICATATTAQPMILGRLLQGLGGALLVPSSLGLVNSAFAPHARGHAVGLWASFSAVGGGLGPLIGGFLIEQWSWTGVFWMNLVVVVIAWVLVAGHRVAPRLDAMSRFDWRGAAYSIFALSLLTYATIESSTYGLNNPLIISLLIASCVIAWWFLRSQRRNPNPMLPLEIFRSLDFRAVNIVTFMTYCTIGGGFYIIMLTWMQVQGYSPMVAGTIALPFMICTTLLAHPVGHIVRVHGARLPLTFGAAGLGIGFLSFAIPGSQANFLTDYAPGVVMSAVGIAVLLPPLTTVVMGSVEPARAGLASGINSAVARSAILLSVAVLGAVHYAVFEYTAVVSLRTLKLTPALHTHMQSELINLMAAKVPADIAQNINQQINEVIALSFIRGVKVVMIISGGLSFCAALIAFRYVERRPKAPVTN